MYINYGSNRYLYLIIQTKDTSNQSYKAADEVVDYNSV